ncbi:sensor histidine kinase [Paenibacillus whitsoniae]|uniref:Sensor histidine kinase n=1 Tax=Paenibacillus whitsoniae TaxID=2496558 RepID=A0A430JJZ0_9BACL|nr:sensor histidine kinase [Paenibacillus whitsoniae]RTE11306.1 sensor histidine kinase [Paenibacillus whitsoniae]
MDGYKRRLTNMIWRSMGEAIVFSFVVFGVVLYFLNSRNIMLAFTGWQDIVTFAFMSLIILTVVGAVYGYWNSSRVTRRLDPMMEALLLLEKGTFTRGNYANGEDEIGRLGEQLERVVKRWEEQVTSLQRLSNHNVELTEKAKLTAVIEERQRLARELHDAVSQQLFAISMTATAVGRTLDKDFEKAKRQIHLIEEMASVAQSEMRALLLHLRPIHLEGKRLSEGLTELLKELAAKVPMAITWDMDEEIRLNKGIEDHLFRIVQEALSNALRHSKANKLEVKLLHRSDGIRLVIRDDGVGFELDAKKLTSYGIVSMKERVNEIGGSVDIITAPDRGTRIEIRVPILAGDVQAIEG